MKTLTVNYSRKIQPAQFESMGLEVTIEKEVDDDKLAEIASKTVSQLRVFVTDKLAESLEWEKQQLKKQ